MNIVCLNIQLSTLDCFMVDFNHLGTEPHDTGKKVLTTD